MCFAVNCFVLLYHCYCFFIIFIMSEVGSYCVHSQGISEWSSWDNDGCKCFVWWWHILLMFMWCCRQCFIILIQVQQPVWCSVANAAVRFYSTQSWYNVEYALVTVFLTTVGAWECVVWRVTCGLLACIYVTIFIYLQIISAIVHLCTV